MSKALPHLLPPDAPRFHLLWKTTTSGSDPKLDDRWGAHLAQALGCCDHMQLRSTAGCKLHLPRVCTCVQKAADALCGGRSAYGTPSLSRSYSICPSVDHCRHEAGDKETQKYLLPPWRLFQARAITAQAKAQRLNVFWNRLHFIPTVYEELNTVLLNTLCDEDDQFAPVQL